MVTLLIFSLAISIYARTSIAAEKNTAWFRVISCRYSIWFAMLICLIGGSRETPAERRIYSLKRECVQRPRPANGEETSGGSSRSNQQIANAGTMGAIWGKSAKALVQRNGTSADGRQNVLVKRVGKRGDQKLRQTIGIEAGLPFPAADTPVPQLVG